MAIKDIQKLCLDNGMTQEEFIGEIRRCYATYVSLALDEDPAKILSEEYDFGDHTIIIKCGIMKKTKSDGRTIN